MTDTKQKSKKEAPKSVYIEAPVAVARFNFNPFPPVEAEVQNDSKEDN